MLAQAPTDAFVHYAIALEHGTVSLTDGIAKLSELRTTHPTYLPTYYRLAAWQDDAGLAQAAIATAQAGLALADSQQAKHAATELRALLDSLLTD